MYAVSFRSNHFPLTIYNVWLRSYSSIINHQEHTRETPEDAHTPKEAAMTKSTKGSLGRGMHWALFGVLGSFGLSTGICGITVFRMGVMENNNLSTQVLSCSFSASLLCMCVIFTINMVSLIGGRNKGTIWIGKRFRGSWNHESEKLTSASRTQEKDARNHAKSLKKRQNSI